MWRSQNVKRQVNNIMLFLPGLPVEQYPSRLGLYPSNSENLGKQHVKNMTALPQTDILVSRPICFTWFSNTYDIIKSSVTDIMKVHLNISYVQIPALVT